MGIERLNPSADKSPESIEVNDFEVSMVEAENLDYAYVNLKREGIKFTTVVKLEDGSIVPDIDDDSNEYQRSRASVLKTMIPEAIKEALRLKKEPPQVESAQGEFDLEGPDFDPMGSTPGRRATKDLPLA